MDSGEERQDVTGENTPEQRPGRRRWPWIVGGLAVLGLLVLTVVSVVVVVAVSSGDGGTASGRASVYEEEYVAGEGDSKVAVVPVEGAISSADSALSGQQPTTTPDGLEDALDQAANDSNVAAVVLEVNSPGGGVTASDLMHQSILDFKENSDKPVVVSMGDTAASGGYYISTAADEIYANETTLTGSLGVILQFTDFSEAAEKLGVEQEVIKSGRYKDIGSSFRDLRPKEREILQSIVDESYDEFVSVIVQGRDLPEERVREIADGRIYSGQQAMNLGLIDEFGDLEEAARRAGELANAGDVTVVRYVQSPSFSDLLSARLAPEEPQAVQIMKAAGLSPEPRLLYLYAPGE
jgi:protease-4